MYVPFAQMPEYARVWVYQAARKIEAQEKEIIQNRMKEFCEGWNTHGNRMPTSFEIVDDQILVLAVDESQLGASGCSIDSSVRTLREIESQLGINLTDQGKISLKNSLGKVSVIPALGIKSRVTSGEITEELEVINPIIQTKADLQNLWQPVRKSWLNKYFPN
ncbi:hypothetical protein [Algoriphagus mannitolivorans]|uniref:hypothetical protein n=1 Tax=Algoriphagus mannitolivorans TaxID=226504 RepID=UPI00041C47BF|nr:hypothetical protein [Algoriphagus mannitolivorans]